MGGFVQGEPNFIVFDGLVLATVILFFIRFFTEKVDVLLGLVALCLIGIWIWLFYVLPRSLERKPDPRVSELVEKLIDKTITPEEEVELHLLLTGETEEVES
jgi:Ca2+/Na+ antiporter